MLLAFDASCPLCSFLQHTLGLVMNACSFRISRGTQLSLKICPVNSCFRTPSVAREVVKKKRTFVACQGKSWCSK